MTKERDRYEKTTWQPVLVGNQAFRNPTTFACLVYRWRTACAWFIGCGSYECGAVPLVEAKCEPVPLPLANHRVSPVQDALQHEDVSGQLSKRERDVIKSRYAAFNEAFTKVFAMQAELSVPDGVRRGRKLASLHRQFQLSLSLARSLSLSPPPCLSLSSL